MTRFQKFSTLSHLTPWWFPAQKGIAQHKSALQWAQNQLLPWINGNPLMAACVLLWQQWKVLAFYLFNMWQSGWFSKICSQITIEKLINYQNFIVLSNGWSSGIKYKQFVALMVLWLSSRRLCSLKALNKFTSASFNPITSANASLCLNIINIKFARKLFC